MSHTFESAATRMITNDVRAERVASTKDDGRVKFGGSGIRFTDAPASTKDAGRVKVGGSSIRFTDAPARTKDAGRVKVGGSSIRF